MSYGCWQPPPPPPGRSNDDDNDEFDDERWKSLTMDALGIFGRKEIGNNSIMAAS